MIKKLHWLAARIGRRIDVPVSIPIAAGDAAN